MNGGVNKCCTSFVPNEMDHKTAPLRVGRSCARAAWSCALANDIEGAEPLRRSSAYRIRSMKLIVKMLADSLLIIRVSRLGDHGILRRAGQTREGFWTDPRTPDSPEFLSSSP